MDKKLLLFSGGVESTVLLKYFLKETDYSIHILYNQLGYCDFFKKKIPEQNKASNNVLNYFKKNYRDFDYSTTKIDLDVTIQQQMDKGFGFDEQWNMFFAGMYAKIFGIKDIWIAEFSYVNVHGTKMRGYPAYWFHDGTLEKYMSLGLALDWNYMSNIKINFPSKNFNKTGIDSFNSKKEAFDYLEPELRKLVRSCEREEKFCGECYKCILYKELNIVTN